MITAYARYMNYIEDDFVEVYEEFDDLAEAEEWVSIQLDMHDCLDAYITE